MNLFERWCFAAFCLIVILSLHDYTDWQLYVLSALAGIFSAPLFRKNEANK